VIQNVIGAPSQALQIIFEMESQRMTSKKTSSKENMFFQLQNAFFFHSSSF